MRTLLSTSVAIAVLALGVTAANAQDLTKGPANWTGPYVGGQIGYTWQPRDGDEHVTYSTSSATLPTTFCGGAPTSPSRSTGCRKDNDAGQWKIHAGYDYEFGTDHGPVIGAVIEGGKAYLFDNVTAFSSSGNVYRLGSKLKENGSIRGRVGYDYHGTMLYGTGGLAYGKIHNTFATSDTTAAFTTSHSSKGAWGFNYGGGIEQKVGPVSIGALYLFTSLKNHDYSVHATGGIYGTGTDMQRQFSKFGYHTIAATVSYRF
jgi:outer membrane immunogenic protein